MANKSEILIIDDDKQIVESLSALFKEKGYVPFGVYTGQKGIELALNDVFELILLDVSLPDFDSLELIKRIKGLRVAAPIIVLTEPENLNRAIELSQNSAVNILIKPLDNEFVMRAAIKAIEYYHVEEDVRGLRKSLSEQYNILGRSETIDQLREKLKRIAMSSSRVLLTGETGSGKKAAAKFIHFSSSRAALPFQIVNCAQAASGKADDIHRLECDLFGYERGAFVGADMLTKGRFELADGGTLYLEEVGALPRELQAKLLRTIESGTAERIGGTHEVKIEARVLAGSTIDLEAEVKAGRFREDLYFRLNVIPVAVPPLRSYPTDIPYLIRYLLDDAGYIRVRLTAEAIDYAKIFDWPGNIRQLRDAIVRAAGNAVRGEMTLDVLQTVLADDNSNRIQGHGAKIPMAGLYKPELSYRDHVIAYEQQLLNEVLNSCDSNITKAAEMLKTDRGNLSKKIKKLGIKAKE
jgi:DNA-binding NtrC family response regulator